MKLFLDFETYYDTKSGYTLGKKGVSVVEYVRDSRFKIHGVGVGNESEIKWFGSEQIPYLFTNCINWSETDVVAHNAKFDGFILKQHYNVQPRSWICTQGMAAGVLGKKIKSNHLRDLAEFYKLEPKGSMKTDGIVQLNFEQEEELAEYCKHDTYLCREIYKRLEKDFPKTQYSFLSWTIQNFIEPKLILDGPLLERIVKTEEIRKNDLFNKLKIPKSVFSSNKQFAEILQTKGYVIPYKVSPRTGKTIPALALGDPQFLNMKNSQNLELKTLCEARIEAKSVLLETRAKRLAQISKTGSWPFDVVFSGAKQTHRLSGGSGAGGNPQNFPRDSRLRQAVCSPKGYKLVVGDFSQIEMRLVAYLSRDLTLIRLIEQDRDLYCEFASKFYGRSITRANKLERKFGKTAILGLGYGMGWERFQKQIFLDIGLSISNQDAKNAISLYRKTYYSVPKLWNILEHWIPTLCLTPLDKSLFWINIRPIHEGLELPSGLKILYPNLRKNKVGWIYDVWDKKVGGTVTRKLYGGKILENICQGLAGELCKEVANKFGDKVVGLVHDEIILCVKKEEAKSTAQELQHQMTISPKWLPEIKLDCEVKIGDNWRETK